MSIATELTNYRTYLTNAYNKCEDKNATIPTNKNLQNLTPCINSIPGYPYKHTELTYIESTGTQYIDTGFKANPNTRVLFDFQIVTVQNSKGIFGSMGGLWFNTYVNGSGKYAFSYKDSTNNSISTNITVDTSRHTIDFDGKNKYYKLDNSSFSLASYTATLDATQNIALMAYNNQGTVQAHIKMKLYSCKIYDNGTLVRDYIPVIHYGIPCLYDKVEHKYYFNQGTGTFTAGDMVLDYIESTGTQWINSNVISKVGTTVKMNLMLTQIPSSNAYFYGNIYSNSLNVGLVFYYSSDILRWGLRRNTYVGYSTGGGTNSPQANVKYNIEAYWNANAQRLYVNGASRVSTTTALTDSGSRALILFGNSQAAVSQLKMRLYDCQIYQNDVLVADFIPVLKADTGEPCLYDKTRNVYELNSGSGTFLFG